MGCSGRRIRPDASAYSIDFNVRVPAWSEMRDRPDEPVLKMRQDRKNGCNGLATGAGRRSLLLPRRTLPPRADPNVQLQMVDCLATMRASSRSVHGRRLTEQIADIIFCVFKIRKAVLRLLHHAGQDRIHFIQVRMAVLYVGF